MEENTLTQTPAAEAPPAFDPKAFMEKRNAAQKPAAAPPAEAPKPKEGEKPAATVATPAEGDGAEPKPPNRAERRRERRLLEEIGRLKAQNEMLQGQGAKPAEGAVSRETTADDPEPQRKDFATDADFNRALGRWDARQETKKTLQAAGDIEAQRAHMAEMAEKASEDMARFDDWDKAREESIENGPTWAPKDHPVLMALMANSEEQAAILYHVARNHDLMQELLDLEKTPRALIQKFHRLEGTVSVMYASKQKPAAEAAVDGKPVKEGQKPEERSSPEKPPEKGGANAKPKPTSELAARGGQAPVLEDPKPGSKEWMQRRNALQFQR